MLDDGAAVRAKIPHRLDGAGNVDDVVEGELLAA